MKMKNKEKGFDTAEKNKINDVYGLKKERPLKQFLSELLTRYNCTQLLVHNFRKARELHKIPTDELPSF